MLPTFVIGLREGLEAALIVGIIAAFLVQQRRHDALRWVWVGVGLAATVCMLAGIGLHVAGEELPRRQQEALETVIAVVAVGMVTWMIVWMRQHAGTLASQLREDTAAALATGSAMGLVLMAFLAVLREGLETAAFLLAAFNASTNTTAAAAGAILGLAVSIGVGVGIYRGGVKLNLARFFKVTSVLLTFVAAGLLSRALHTAHEAGWFGGLQAQAFDLSGFFTPGDVHTTLFTGFIGLEPAPTVGEIGIYLLYAIPMLVYVLRPAPARPAATATTEPSPITRRNAAMVIGGGGIALLATGALFATAATGDDQPTGSASIALSDAGCSPAELTLPAGPTTFDVTNDGSGSVTEFEILDGQRILAEAENVAAGLERSVSVTLKPGEYEIACPGGTETETGTLTVTGDADDANPQLSAEGQAAVAAYRKYLVAQTALLTPKVEQFAADVKAGRDAKAKAAFAAARAPYERVEPVAESFGDLDPRIDIRINDVAPGDDFTGFHRIERALWTGKGTDGIDAVADQLVADAKTLQSRVTTVELEPAQIANGAVELLGEVSKSKITGEEDRYSHTDLADFQANVEGSQAAFNTVRPLLVAKNPPLAEEIDGRFDAVFAALDEYESGGTFVLYTDLSDADKRKLSGVLDRLAEPLSQVPAQVI